jgi:CRP-like cAMP-binding protein
VTEHPPRLEHRFQHVDVEALYKLHDRHGVVYPRGRVIYRQAELSQDLYVVLRGSVEFFIRDEQGGEPIPVAIAQPGEYFGELGCFGREARRTTAVVREDETALLLFDPTSATELLRNSPRFALDIVNALANRLLTLDFENTQLKARSGHVHNA